MGLEKSRIQCWEDLADAFLRKYKYNLNMEPNQMQLRSLTMKEIESFKEYAQRWRELAAQLEPPLSKKEMTRIFVDTLKDPYFDRLVSSGTTGFFDFLAISDCIKKGLKNGNILSNNGEPNAQKKFSRNF